MPALLLALTRELPNAFSRKVLYFASRSRTLVHDWMVCLAFVSLAGPMKFHA